MRVGSDGRANVVTAMQDIGTGTRTAMAQIAAEELGLPLDHVESRSATPRAARTRRSRPARRRCPRWARPCERPPPTRSGRSSRSRPSATTSRSVSSTSRTATSSRPTAARGRSRRSSACSRTRRSSARARAARTRRGCSVLTFGVQVAEVAVDIETGEVRVERIAAIHDVGRVINPLGARARSRAGSSRRSATRSRRCGSTTRATGHDPHARRSTRTSCRRSPTCPRSSASSSTYRTST